MQANLLHEAPGPTNPSPDPGLEQKVQAKAVKENLKIVFFGLGSIGTRLARIVKQRFGHEVYAFRTKAEGIPEVEIEAIHSLKKLEDLLPDVAFISNPTALHLETAVKAASLGSHLFIEKPLSAATNGWERLETLVEEKRLITFVGCNLRFDPIIQHLKYVHNLSHFFYARVIASSYLPHWRPAQDYRTSYSSSRSLGGGVILDLVHEPDYCHWLFGPIQSIQGSAGKCSTLELEVEDWAEITLHHQTGFKSHIHLDYFSRHAQRKIELFGRDTYIEADLIERRIKTIKQDGEEIMEFELIDRNYTYEKELDYFFQCLKENRQPMNNIKEHMSVLEPVLQFRKEALGMKRDD